jgi:hypothetical protein
VIRLPVRSGAAERSGAGTDAELLEAAKAVLDANWTGGSTVPSRDGSNNFAWTATLTIDLIERRGA